MVDAFNAVKGYDRFHSRILAYLKAGYWDPEKKAFLAWMFITTKVASINGTEMTGFCFDLDHDSVWLEGTGEMIVAYRSAGEDYTADFYIREMEKIISPSAKDPALAGLPYATTPCV
jgi:hypothetical protein